MSIIPPNINLDPTTQKSVDKWLQGSFDERAKKEIETLFESPDLLIDAFYTHLKFGSGGLRGLMGVGPNRINIYTIRGATQGLALYLKKQFKGSHPLSVFIGFDSRLNSKQFAEEAAKVLAANQIEVFLFKNLRPLPLVSFGCRFKKTQAGIMITASHNAPEYNGYKIFWQDGGQIRPPHDKGVIDEIKQITELDQIKCSSLTDPLIHYIHTEIDEEYLQTISDLPLLPETNLMQGDNLNIVYTALHGTGLTIVPQALAMWGFTTINYVEKQCEPDGHFPTVTKPNPEEPSTLSLGIEKLIEVKGDVLFATDPDADRLGVGVRHQDTIYLLSGNQVASLLTYHLVRTLKEQNRAPEKGIFIKSIVTSELMTKILETYGYSCINTLPGFKYIAEKINEIEQEGNHFLFAAEESCGYLYGTHVRDKDALISLNLFAEMALKAKIAHKTVIDDLNEIYETWGVFREKVSSVDFGESRAGRAQMERTIQDLRLTPPQAILGTKIVIIKDYQSSTQINIETQQMTHLDFLKSNILEYHLADQSILTVRPSGTEPKIKVYASVRGKPHQPLPLAIEHCDNLADEYLKTLKIQLLQQMQKSLV